jgi:hypothetical protein
LDEFVPSVGDAAAGRSVVEQIRAIPGDVLVVNHPALALAAGKKTYAHQMAFIDVYDADRDPRGVRTLLAEKWGELFEQKHFSAVVLDNDWYVYLEALKENYVNSSELRLGPGEMMPKTGT